MSCEMSSRCLQDVFARRLQDVFKTSSRRLGRRKNVTLKTCWRRLQDMGSILPIRTESSQIVMTVFWVDNFDVTVENDLGDGAVNRTHHMAFQEQVHHDKH